MTQEKTIEQVKKDWESRLMATSGVTGVAIGLAKDRQKTVIKIYVDSTFSNRASQIPSTIEGYSTEIESRRTFRAW